MLLQHPINLVDLKGQRIAFWSAGNRPTQELFGLATPEVVSHMRTLYLISDKVLAAASFFFESQIARAVTGKLMPLFKSGDILYFVDSSIETFSEHGFAKIQKSPPELTAYTDSDIVAKHGEVMDSLGYILRRPSLSLSDRIVDLWIQDVMSVEIGTLGAYLGNLIQKEKHFMSLKNELSNIALSRQKDFVWEYIAPKLQTMQLPVGFLPLARRRLAQMYALATSEYLGASLDRPEHASLSAYIKDDSKYDSALFLTCMETLRVRQHLDKLPGLDVVQLKGREEFRVFREFYFSIIKAASYQQEELKTWLPLYRRFALKIPENGLTRIEFLRGFRSLCRSMNRSTRIYAKPLDQLVHVYEQFGFLAIEDFVNRLLMLSKSSSKIVRIFSNAIPTEAPDENIEVTLKKMGSPELDSVRVCLVQLDYHVELTKPPSIFGYVLAEPIRESTRQKVVAALRVAREEHCDLVCFPELCFMPDWLEETREFSNNIVIVAGSYYQNRFNTCPVIIDGRTIDIKKINPSDDLEEDAGEGRGMAKGKEIIVFQTRFGKFVVLICIDYMDEAHRVLYNPNKEKQDVDFIINPCYNRDVVNFQKQADLDCLRANKPYILQANVAAGGKDKKHEGFGGTSIIGTDHDSALQRYRGERYVPDGDQIRYKFLQVEDSQDIKEMILIANLDVKRKGVPVPPDGLKMKNVCRYIYKGNRWQKYIIVGDK